MGNAQASSPTPIKKGEGPRKPAERLSSVNCGPLTLNIKAMTVTKGDRVIQLTPKECQLLTAFMRYPGQLLTRELLINEIWETTFMDDLRILYVHVHLLRKKIEDDPRHPKYVQTVRGRGYRFVVPDTADLSL